MIKKINYNISAFEAHLGIPPNKCLAIEDSPHGVEAAKRAGMYVVALLTTHNRNQLEHADVIVSDFSDLL